MLADKRMEHINKIRMTVPRGCPTTIEFDHNVRAWYVRFRNAKVAKTISEDKPGFMAAIDLDANNEVIGLELLGATDFSLKRLRQIAPSIQLDVSRVDLDSAVFVPAHPKAHAGV